jgi:hypothetical protein
MVGIIRHEYNPARKIREDNIGGGKNLYGGGVTS